MDLCLARAILRANWPFERCVEWQLLHDFGSIVDFGRYAILYPIMKLDSKTSAAVAAEKIRSLILGGRFAPGSPLRQDSLSAELGLSRTPLRQALQILNEEGLVSISGFKGARVAEITPDLIDDLFEMRCALEPLALSHAVPALSKIDLAKAEMALDLAVDEHSPARLSELNWQFHQALYAPSGRSMLLETIRRLNMTSSLAEIIAQSITVRSEQSHSEHLALLDACRLGDQGAAVALLSQHLASAYADIKTTYRV